MPPAKHLVICGFGAVGAAVARSSLLNGRRAGDIVVIDLDDQRLESARRLGFQAISADAADVSRLRVAQVGAATDVILCIGQGDVVSALRSIRSMAPDARVQVALHDEEHREEALSLGADNVIVLSRLAGEMLARSVA